jgi:hypothetical protein
VKALETAAQGKERDFSESQFAICDNKDALRAAYEKQYDKGATIFCAIDKIRDAGFERGDSGQAADFSSDKYRMCGAERLEQIHVSYDKGFQEGLSKFCSGTRVEEEAYKDGTQGNAMADTTQKYQLCKMEQKTEIAQRNEKGYQRGLKDFCSPAGLEKEARRKAQESASPEFPPRLNLCLASYPEAKTDYPNLFRVERQKFVESHCSYQEGLVSGRTDAESTEHKRSGMPTYCDADSYANFKEGYLQGWKEAKDKICDVNRAYDKGAQDALADKSMQYTPPAQCPTEYLSTLQRKYRDGYTYAKNQPRIVAAAKTDDVYTTGYSSSEAEDLCRQAGNEKKVCRGVTSLACIRKGFSPQKCKIETKYIAAVDACLNKGFDPSACAKVKDADCIASGKAPLQCRNIPTTEDN